MRVALSLALVAIVGCSASGEVPRTAPVTARTVGLVRDSLVTAPTEAARRAVAARRLAAAGLTPLAGGTPRAARDFGTDPEGSVVGGYVPGRHPLGRSQLVVLGSPLDEASAPVVLEAARVLVARSEVQNVPERTVQIALWDGRRPDREGIASAFDLALWPREAIVSVVAVGDEAGLIDVQGVPVVVLLPTSDAPVLVDRVVSAVLAAATYQPPVVADSTR